MGSNMKFGVSNFWKGHEGFEGDPLFFHSLSPIHRFTKSTKHIKISKSPIAATVTTTVAGHQSAVAAVGKLIPTKLSIAAVPNSNGVVAGNQSPRGEVYCRWCGKVASCRCTRQSSTTQYIIAPLKAEIAVTYAICNFLGNFEKEVVEPLDDIIAQDFLLLVRVQSSFLHLITKTETRKSSFRKNMSATCSYMDHQHKS